MERRSKSNEIQADPKLAYLVITQNAIIRFPNGEGCKKRTKRLKYEWGGNEMIVSPTPATDEYGGENGRGRSGNGANAEAEEQNAQDESKAVEEKGTNTPTEEAVNIKEGRQGEQEQENGGDRIKGRLMALLRYQKQKYSIQGVWRGFVKMDEVLETPPMKDLEEQTFVIKDVIEKNPDTFQLEVWKKDEYIRLVWKEGPADILK